MRRRMWLLVLLALGLLIVLNRMSVQTLKQADSVSLEQRRELYARLDSLAARVTELERRQR